MDGSPAVDVALFGPLTDQRGVLRPQGLGTDIGAYEVDAAGPPPPFVGRAMRFRHLMRDLLALLHALAMHFRLHH